MTMEAEWSSSRLTASMTETTSSQHGFVQASLLPPLNGFFVVFGIGSKEQSSTPSVHTARAFVALLPPMVTAKSPPAKSMKFDWRADYTV